MLSTPSTADFLAAHVGAPEESRFAVTADVQARLSRSLWQALLSVVPAPHLLPRAQAPTAEHALALLEASGWRLAEAQRRAARAAAETARGDKGKGVEGRVAAPSPALAAYELGPEYAEERKGMPCGHVFKKGEAIYRCRDCGLDDTCVQCAPCFNASNHQGHDIIFSVSSSSGGCCDCGDDEAWKCRLGCSFHEPGPSQASDALSAAGPSVQRSQHASEMDADDDDGSSDVFWNASEDSKQAQAPVPPPVLPFESLLQPVPRDILESLTEHISTLLAYVLDTLEHAPEDMKLPDGSLILDYLKDMPTLQPSEESTEGKQRLYAVVLWNDEKHSFKEVIDTVIDATGVSEAQAKRVAERVDKHGREVIEISSEIRRLLIVARKLSVIDLAVTVRPAYDIFAEELAHHVLSLILDLANSSLFLHPSSLDGEMQPVHPLDGLRPDAAVMRAIVGRVLLERWAHQFRFEQGGMTRQFWNPDDLRKIDGLFLLDQKMWKGARSLVRSVFISIMGPREVKREVALRLARMYPKIIETFILRDREPEHSVRLMTVQLFSVPSIARELVASHDYNFLQKLLLMLQAVFTGGLTQMSLELPPLPPANGMASPQSMLIRHQRCYQMFHDVRYLLAATGVQTLLVEQSAHLDYFLPFLALFNGIAPNRRAQGEHVEFESEVWVPVFHVVTQLARAAAQFGAAFSRATSLQLSDALVTTARVILMNTLKLHQNQPDSYEPIESRLVSFAGQTYDIIDFHVDAQPVSFHHPMHWLLAELLKHVNGTITPEALSMFAVLRSARTDSFTLPDIFPRDVDESARLTIIDFPLRVIVKLAQIRAGMWVRNGYMIRQQAHHYREHTMRDCMSDQDLFLVQAGLMLVSADRLLVSVLDRFALREWFDGEREHEVLSEDQCSLMVEELLLLLVTLVSETSIAQSWAIEQQVRREIVHFLALSQGTYSDLTKHISDRFTDHSSFDRVLAQVSNFRAPDGTADLGMFELRDECYDEVQPFFFHYTRNQREKADDVLRERHRKRNGGQQAAADAYVAVPARRLAPGQGIFIGSLHSALTSPVLIRIATAALERWGVSGDPAMPEPYVDAALQLLMHVLIERGAEGARAMAQPHNQSLGCAIDVLCDLEKFITFKPIKAKASWLVDRALAEDREAVAKVLPADRVTQAKSQGAPAAEDPKRAAARARQAAIMQQFSAQQKSLLDALADEELDEDGAGDGEDVTMADDDAPSGSTYRSMGDCIMCQESLDGSSAFGSLALVQSSRILRTTPRRQGVFLQQALDTPLTLDRNGPDGRRVTNAYREPVPGTPAASSSVYYPAEDHRDGFFASTCGHMMHVNCFDSYCRSVEHRHGQQIARNHPENLTRHEFVCPLCKSLGNVILPVPDEEATAPPTLIAMPLTEWMRKINIEILKTSASSGPTELQELEHGTGSFVPWYAEEALVWAREQQGAQVNLDQATWKMLDRLVQVLRPLSSRTRPAREAFQIRSILAPPGRKMYMPEELVAYTISMLEVSQRGTTPTQSASPNATVADSLPDPTNQLLNSLLHALRSIARVDHAGPRGLATMQQGLLKRLLPHWGNDETVRGPLLLRDPLTILIEAAVLAPGSLGQITTLMYYATLVHVIFGLAQPSIWPQTASHMGRAPSAGLRPAELGPGEAEMLRTVFPDVRWTVANIIGFVGYARGNITLGVDALDDVSLAKMLCTYTLPFLRRAAILHRAVGLKMAPASAASGTSEYLRLLHGLQIPPPAEGLPVRAERQTALASMVEGWIKHAYTALASLFRPLPIYAPPISALGTPGTHLHPSSAHPTLQLEHPHIYELVQLPRDLATLLQDTQRRICKRCKEAPPEPAVCLECGDVLCVQCFCCQDEQSERGECNRHLEECGGATGVFFKVKTNIIVLLYAGNGSYTTSPYLDTHGEFDIGLRKGRPQHLHAQRYDEQRKQWLTQSVPHVVARKLESVMDQGGWSTL